jgi:hypothetical protein
MLLKKKNQIMCCIDEWTDGTYKPSNWKEDRYKTAYHSHLKSLTDLQDHEPPRGQRPLAQIQSDLLKEARYVLPLSMISFFLTHSPLQAYMRVPHLTLQRC